MTLTLDDLVRRREASGLHVQKLYEEIHKLQARADEESALVVQLLLLEVAAEDPSITEFSFDANFEYDDEGSYFWSVSFGSDGDNEDADPWERFEEVEQYADQQSTQIAFGSKTGFEGRITVSKLLEEVAV